MKYITRIYYYEFFSKIVYGKTNTEDGSTLHFGYEQKNESPE